MSLINGFDFWRDEQTILAIVGIVASLLFFLTLIGYLKEVKSLIWLGIIVLSTYTLYIIGSLIWSFTPETVYLFLVALVILLTIVYIIVIFKMKEKVSLL